MHRRGLLPPGNGIGLPLHEKSALSRWQWKRALSPARRAASGTARGACMAKGAARWTGRTGANAQHAQVDAAAFLRAFLSSSAGAAGAAASWALAGGDVAIPSLPSKSRSISS